MLLLSFAACGPLEKPEEMEGPEGPDDPLSLRIAFEAIVEQARQGKREELLQALEPYLATKEDLEQLFGVEKGPMLWRGYNDTIVLKLREEAADAIIHQVKAGAHEIKVKQVGPAYPAATTKGDQLMLDAMQKKLPMYSLKFRKPGADLGLRFNGFLFLNGRWKMLLKAYEYLPAVEP